MHLGGVASGSSDPISEWADANPGGFAPEFDLRGQTNGQQLIRDFLDQHRRARTPR